MTEGLRPRVLIVDDNTVVRRLLAEQLAARGDVEVAGEAADAATGIRAAANLTPDVVLLDLSMPGGSGLDAIAELRAVAPQARIVVMSGFAADEVLDQVMAAGASAYLEKSLRMDISQALLGALAEPASPA